MGSRSQNQNQQSRKVISKRLQYGIGRLLVSCAIFVQLAISVLSSFIDINLSIAGDCVGYSITTNLMISYMLIRLKYPVYVFSVSIGLLSLNLLGLLESLGILSYYEYENYWNMGVICLILILSVSITVKKHSIY